MAARLVQILMEPDLLDQIDADPEAREKGRSAFIRAAVQLYLEAKRRQEIEKQLARAYAGEADSLLEEVEILMSRPVGAPRPFKARLPLTQTLLDQAKEEGPE